MAEKINLIIASIEKKVFEQEVDSLILPTEEGETGILYNHIPLITTLEPGELHIKQQDKTTTLAISGGFAEVNNNKVTVLADLAERIEDLNLEKIAAAKKEAEETMKKKGISEIEFKEAERELRRSITLIKVAEKRHKKHHIISEQNPNLK